MTAVQSVYKSVYAQSTGVIFAGRDGLDFLELRLGTVRIPEVSLRIREAQRILDGLDVEPIDLHGATTTEDESFFRNIKIKSLLAAIVQVGLYDRLLKSQRAPDVLIGNSNGDSALLVCTGQMTFENMIKTSSALQTLRPREVPEALKIVANGAAEANAVSTLPSGNSTHAPFGLLPGFAPILVSNSQHQNSATEDLSPGPLPSLAGLNLTEFRAFARADEGGGVVELGGPVMDLKKLVAEVVEHQMVTRFINLGPAAAIPTSEFETIAEMAGTDEVTVIDSIDLDPMLNWFWRQMRPVVSGLAQ